MTTCRRRARALSTRDLCGNFVKRCTGAVIISSEPRVVGYAAAASCAAGEGGRNVIIIETRARDDAEWSRALQAINPGLHFWFCVAD